MASAKYQRAWRRANPDKVRQYNRTALVRKRDWGRKNRVRPTPEQRQTESARYYLRNRAAINRRNKIASLWRKYRLTLSDLDRMKLSQKGRCRICARKAPDIRLCVDHCHETNKVRALLCNACNRGLGYFGDSPVRLARAAKYVRAHA